MRRFWLRREREGVVTCHVGIASQYLTENHIEWTHCESLGLNMTGDHFILIAAWLISIYSFGNQQQIFQSIQTVQIKNSWWNFQSHCWNSLSIVGGVYGGISVMSHCIACMSVWESLDRDIIMIFICISSVANQCSCCNVKIIFRRSPCIVARMINSFVFQQYDSIIMLASQ